jgi:hypothetical protein
MGQYGQPGEFDAGKRQHFFGTYRSALDAAEDEGGQGAGGSGFIHDAAFGAFHIVAEAGRGGG